MATLSRFTYLLKNLKLFCSAVTDLKSLSVRKHGGRAGKGRVKKKRFIHFKNECMNEMSLR